MAIGLASNFQIYQEQINGGFVEELAQNTAAFNAASANAIRLITDRKRGEYEQTSFFENVTSLITRRDLTSVSSATDQALTQDEFVSVKLARKIGPIANTLDSFRKVARGANDQALSFLLGTQIAKAIQADMLNSALRAARNGLDNQTNNTFTTAGATQTIETTDLVEGLNLFGDQAQRIVLWVMHSKVFYDLVKEQIGLAITNVADVNIVTGMPITLGRPVLVTDSAALIDTGSPTGDDDYYTLGLVRDGVTVEDSEEETIHTELVSGLENLVVRLQGEFAYNLGLKGFKWDVTNGGANPTDATVATGTNWDSVMDSAKDLAGVVIQSK